jgi:hypothetical protein
VDDARPWVERAVAAARLLNARTTTAAAAALWAEITGDTTGLPPVPDTARGVTDMLVLRAYASRGDTVARDTLAAAALDLAMPGLTLAL